MPRTAHLRRFRLARELTKQALAGLAGVAYDTVRRAEAGQSISDVSAAKLARALKVEVGDLWPELAEERAS